MSEAKRILVTGATGFVGKNFVERRNDCVAVSRRDEHSVKKELPTIAGAVQWDGKSQLDLSRLDGEIEHVVHMMGESLANGRWNDEKKKRIRDSRVNATQQLVASLGRLKKRPRSLVSFSAVGFYGERGEEILTEESKAGSDFLADVCQEWETAAMAASEYGIRVVLLRCGIVLGQGGALEKMKTPFLWCVGGRLGSGKQWMPWIHVKDLINLVEFSTSNTSLQGPVNTVAPGLVRNSEFTKIFASALNRPAFLPVPTNALKVVFGEFADELLVSRKVVPAKLNDSGFEFEFPKLKQAIEDSLNQSNTAEIADHRG